MYNALKSFVLNVSCWFMYLQVHSFASQWNENSCNTVIYISHFVFKIEMEIFIVSVVLYESENTQKPTWHDILNHVSEWFSWSHSHAVSRSRHPKYVYGNKNQRPGTHPKSCHLINFIRRTKQALWSGLNCVVHVMIHQWYVWFQPVLSDLCAYWHFHFFFFWL